MKCLVSQTEFKFNKFNYNFNKQIILEDYTVVENTLNAIVTTEKLLIEIHDYVDSIVKIFLEIEQYMYINSVLDKL